MPTSALVFLQQGAEHSRQCRNGSWLEYRLYALFFVPNRRQKESTQQAKRPHTVGTYKAHSRHTVGKEKAHSRVLCWQADDRLGRLLTDPLPRTQLWLSCSLLLLYKYFTLHTFFFFSFPFIHFHHCLSRHQLCIPGSQEFALGDLINEESKKMTVQ